MYTKIMTIIGKGGTIMNHQKGNNFNDKIFKKEMRKEMENYNNNNVALEDELEVENVETQNADTQNNAKQNNEQEDLIEEVPEALAKDSKHHKEKHKKKDKKDALIEELTDKYKRTFAEFDNYRKRTEKEKTAMYQIGAKDIVEKILPVIDNFERGFSSITDEEKEQPFAQGIEMVYKQLMTTLEEAGLKQIEALNNQFDPNYHNAVMHIEDEELDNNIVVEEFQKGYMYKDAVVRHSMVKVAN